MKKQTAVNILISVLCASATASLMVAFAYISGLRELYDATELFVLNPAFNLLLFQWILGYVSYGLVLFLILNLGRIRHDMQLHFIVVLLALQFVLPTIWPFIFVAIESSVLAILILVALFLLQSWTVVLLRKFSELAAYIHAITASVTVLYVYYTTGAVILNVGIIDFF